MKVRQLGWLATYGAALFIIFSGGVMVGVKRGVPFVGIARGWSVGIYTGPTPFDLHPAMGIAQPVLLSDDVSDYTADIVADPFMVRTETGEWFLFCEVKNRATQQGDIGFARSTDGLRWKWDHIVLDEPFHLSYPQVFQHEGAWYMVPETAQANEVRLYRAKSFPTGWERVATLLIGPHYDSSIFEHEGMWWMYTGENEATMRLWMADALTGPWTEHPASPIYVDDPVRYRCGGRVTKYNGELYRFNQDTKDHYGNQLRAMRVTTLTRTEYAETPLRENSILKASGQGWNRTGMHHCDPVQLPDGSWIACVDGQGETRVYGLKY